VNGVSFLASWASLLLFGAGSAEFAMRAALVDRCSGKATVLTSPNGASIRIRFRGLDPSRPVVLDFEWTLAGVVGNADAGNRIREHHEFDAGVIRSAQDYFFSIPKERVLERIENRLPGSHLWSVNILASQGQEVQGAVSWLLRVGSGFEYFAPKGNPVCHWSSLRRVRSSYYFNPGPDPMEITRTLTRFNETGIGKDLFPPFFEGRGRESMLVERFDYERKWRLDATQGGLFVEQVIFSRLNADHYEWRDAGEDGGCGEYVRTGGGFIDLPESSLEFYTVPPVVAGDEGRLAEFLDSVSPPIRTCDEAPSGDPDLFETGFRFTPVER